MANVCKCKVSKVGKKIFDDKKVTDHFAIVPTRKGFEQVPSISLLCFTYFKCVSRVLRMYSNVFFVLKVFRCFRCFPHHSIKHGCALRPQPGHQMIRPGYGHEAYLRHCLALSDVWCCGFCVQVLGLIIRHCVAAFLPDATWLQTFQSRAHVCSIQNGTLVDTEGKVQEVAKKDTCDPYMFVTLSGC